jgi:hypothetical protein
MNGADPLEQLRDIHMPEAIGWWPLAPGWWMLAVLILGLIVAAIVWRVLRHRRLAYKREALAQWQAIHARFLDDKDTARLLADLAVLLKRTCITRYGRDETAGLAGEQWLAFLDQTGKCTAFSQGAGRVLVSERFTSHPQVDGPALLNVTLAWLNKQC